MRLNEEYAGLSLGEFTELILQRYAAVGLSSDMIDHRYDKPLTATMITTMNRAGLAPSRRFIEENFGGISQLNDYLGFPDIRSWDETEYIQYGARLLKTNGLNSLTFRNIEELSRRHLGPAASAIIRRFGSISAFQNIAIAEYARLNEIEEARTKAVQQHFSETNYGKDVSNDPEERMRIWGRYQVARACIKDLPESELTELAKLENGHFVKKLLSLRPGLKEADVEIMALSLQVADYIWPPKNQRSLKL